MIPDLSKFENGNEFMLVYGFPSTGKSTTLYQIFKPETWWIRCYDTDDWQILQGLSHTQYNAKKNHDMLVSTYTSYISNIKIVIDEDKLKNKKRHYVVFTNFNSDQLLSREEFTTKVGFIRDDADLVYKLMTERLPEDEQKPDFTVETVKDWLDGTKERLLKNGIEPIVLHENEYMSQFFMFNTENKPSVAYSLKP